MSLILRCEGFLCRGYYVDIVGKKLKDNRDAQEIEYENI